MLSAYTLEKLNEQARAELTRPTRTRDWAWLLRLAR